jgi:hypothetical protein
MKAPKPTLTLICQERFAVIFRYAPSALAAASASGSKRGKLASLGDPDFGFPQPQIS